MKKRLLALLLTCVMLLSLLPTTALAGDKGGAINGDTKIDWKQFYGYNSDNTMSATVDDTAGKCTVYVGDTLWNLGTQKTQKDLAQNGITVIPQVGYYVKQVVIACNDGAGYHCNTAQRDGIVKFGSTTTKSASFTIPKDNLALGIKIGDNPVWHLGAGTPLHLMIWLGKSPNPATVTYEAGTIDGQIVSIPDVVSFDASQETQPENITVIETDDVISYEYTGTLSAYPQHTILDINQKAVTVGDKTYQFDGWDVFSQVDNGGEIGWNPVVGSSDVGDTLSLYTNYKLVAKWKEIQTYTITYYFGNRVYASETYPFGAPVTALSLPTKTGYTVDGWYSDAECTNKTTVPETMPAANLSYYAKSTVDPITIDLNDPDGDEYAEIRKVLTGDTAPQETYRVTLTEVLEDPNDTPRTFTGTVTGAGNFTFGDNAKITIAAEGTYTFNVKEEAGTTSGMTYDEEVYTLTITVTEGENGLEVEDIAPIVITNTYQTPVYTITYYLDGIQKDTASYAVGATVTPLSVPTKTGYTVDGWYSNAECTNKTTVPETMPAANLSYYAKSTVDPIKIDLNDPDGDNAAEIIKVLEGDTAPEETYTVKLTEVLSENSNSEPHEFVGTVTGPGNFTFGDDAKIKITEKGMYTFNVKEEAGTTSGMTYDEEVYTLTITVTEGDNGLKVADIEPITIKNAYQAPVQPPVQPPVVKPILTKDHYSYIIGMPDGKVYPEGNLTRAEAVTIFFRMLTDEARNENWSTTNSFSDVTKDAWYNNAISTIANMGIVNGYPDGTFRPTEDVTRGEFAKIAVGFLLPQYDMEGSSFDDVSDTAWYAKYVAEAEKAGLIKGYNGNFRPNDTITRAEACTIVNRLLSRAPDKDHLLSEAKMITWPDNTPDKWYYADIQEATNSHEFSWITVNNNKIEQWRKKLPQRDWAALEKAWSDANDAPGGVVVDR